MSENNDPTNDLKVHNPHPESRERDNVITDRGVMPRSQARAMMQGELPPPKTGVARVQELQNLRVQGKITERQLAELSQKALRGESTEFTVAQTEAAKQDEKAQAEAQRFFDSFNSIIDMSDSIDKRANNNLPINPEMVKKLTDAEIRMLGEARRAGIPADNERIVEMREHIKVVKQQIVGSNAMRKMAR